MSAVIKLSFLLLILNMSLYRLGFTYKQFGHIVLLDYCFWSLLWKKGPICAHSSLIQGGLKFIYIYIGWIRWICFSMVRMDLQQYVQEAGSAVHARPSWIAICSTRGPCGAGSQISLHLKWIPCYLHSWKKEWLSWILTPCCCLTWPTISFGR